MTPNNVLPIDVAGFFQSRAEPGDVIFPLLRRSADPITGRAACCARAANGRAATAEPTIPLMNSRRLIVAPRLKTLDRTDLHQRQRIKSPLRDQSMSGWVINGHDAEETGASNA